MEKAKEVIINEFFNDVFIFGLDETCDFKYATERNLRQFRPQCTFIMRIPKAFTLKERFPNSTIYSNKDHVIRIDPNLDMRILSKNDICGYCGADNGPRGEDRVGHDCWRCQSN